MPQCYASALQCPGVFLLGAQTVALAVRAAWLIDSAPVHSEADSFTVLAQERV